MALCLYIYIYEYGYFYRFLSKRMKPVRETNDFSKLGVFMGEHDEHPITGFGTYNVGLPSCKML